MRKTVLLCAIVVLASVLGSSLAVTSTQLWRSTRVSDPGRHARAGDSRYPYRAKSQYILAELDLRAGDVVVDIGAGDGWWSAQMATDRPHRQDRTVPPWRCVFQADGRSAYTEVSMSRHLCEYQML